MTTTRVEARPRVLGASTLRGNVVMNLAGERLGTIEEFMVDLASGRIAYCVLSFGEASGLAGKLFAVPFGSMTLDTRNHTFTLETDSAFLDPYLVLYDPINHSVLAFNDDIDTSASNYNARVSWTARSRTTRSARRCGRKCRAS